MRLRFTPFRAAGLFGLLFWPAAYWLHETEAGGCSVLVFLTLAVSCLLVTHDWENKP